MSLLCVNECSCTFRAVGLTLPKAQELPATKCQGRMCTYVLDVEKITEKQGLYLLAGHRSHLSLLHDFRLMLGQAASRLLAAAIRSDFEYTLQLASASPDHTTGNSTTDRAHSERQGPTQSSCGPKILDQAALNARYMTSIELSLMVTQPPRILTIAEHRLKHTIF